MQLAVPKARVEKAIQHREHRRWKAFEAVQCGPRVGIEEEQILGRMAGLLGVVERGVLPFHVDGARDHKEAGRDPQDVRLAEREVHGHVGEPMVAQEVQSHQHTWVESPKRRFF